MSKRNKSIHPRSEAQMKVEKAESRKARVEALVWLSNTFPEAFNTDERIRPLKVSIMADILAYADGSPAVSRQGAPISRSKLREAVAMFSHRMDYLTCLKAREDRIDLEGNVVGTVTEEEAELASATIKKRIETVIRNSRKNGFQINPMSHTPAPRSTSHGSYNRGSAPRYPNNNFQRSNHQGGNNYHNNHRGQDRQHGNYNSYNNNHHHQQQGGYPSADRYSNQYRNQNQYQQHGNMNSPSMDDGSMMTHHQNSRPSSNVTVRRKISKTYDPQAVARLKEKLRTSRSTYDEEVID